MWPAWVYGLWAPLPGVCVRRTLPLLGPVGSQGRVTNEPITPTCPPLNAQNERRGYCSSMCVVFVNVCFCFVNGTRPHGRNGALAPRRAPILGALHARSAPKRPQNHPQSTQYNLLT